MRTKILESAIKVLNKEGYAGVTLRRVAKESGIRAPSIYWHFKNKEELLGVMAEYIVKDSPTTPFEGESWEESLLRFSASLYNTLLSHRDGVLVFANSCTDILANKGVEVMEILKKAGFGDKIPVIAFALRAYIVGYSLEEQGRSNRLLPWLKEVGDVERTERFLFGYKLMLDSLKKMLSTGEIL